MVAQKGSTSRFFGSWDSEVKEPRVLSHARISIEKAQYWFSLLNVQCKLVQIKKTHISLMQIKFAHKKTLGILISLKRVNPQISHCLSIFELIVLFSN